MKSDFFWNPEQPEKTGNRVYSLDVLEGMRSLPDQSFCLGIATPPTHFFQGGKRRKVSPEREAEYYAWVTQWLREVHRVLSPSGTLWLAAEDTFAAEFKLLAQREAGFFCENWVIWQDTFTQPGVRRFALSHHHLFQMVKDPKHFEFNELDRHVRIPSERQTRYHDQRANPLGKLPDNTWSATRIHSSPAARQAGYSYDLPETLLGRILRVSSRPGEWVLIPFAGDGAIPVVAKKLERPFLGLEHSVACCERANSRLERCRAGNLLLGESPKDYTRMIFDDSKEQDHLQS